MSHHCDLKALHHGVLRKNMEYFMDNTFFIPLSEFLKAKHLNVGHFEVPHGGLLRVTPGCGVN